MYIRKEFFYTVTTDAIWCDTWIGFLINILYSLYVFFVFIHLTGELFAI